MSKAVLRMIAAHSRMEGQNKKGSQWLPGVWFCPFLLIGFYAGLILRVYGRPLPGSGPDRATAADMDIGLVTWF